MLSLSSEKNDDKSCPMTQSHMSQMDKRIIKLSITQLESLRMMEG